MKTAIQIPTNDSILTQKLNCNVKVSKAESMLEIKTIRYLLDTSKRLATNFVTLRRFEAFYRALAIMNYIYSETLYTQTIKKPIHSNN